MDELKRSRLLFKVAIAILELNFGIFRVRSGRVSSFQLSLIRIIRLYSTWLSPTTGAKGNNLFASNSKLQITNLIYKDEGFLPSVCHNFFLPSVCHNF